MGISSLNRNYKKCSWKYLKLHPDGQTDRRSTLYSKWKKTKIHLPNIYIHGLGEGEEILQTDNNIDAKYKEEEGLRLQCFYNKV